MQQIESRSRHTFRLILYNYEDNTIPYVSFLLWTHSICPKQR